MSALNLTPIFCLHHPNAAAVTRFLPLLLASLLLFTFHSEFTLFSPRPYGRRVSDLSPAAPLQRDKRT